MDQIIPISDFVRNASEHAKRIRETKRVEILTQHGRPSLAVLPAVLILAIRRPAQDLLYS